MEEVAQVICVGDIHAMDRPPRNASETYMDDLIDMLTWIGDEAKRRKVSTIIWAGDIFHHKQPSKTSHALVLRMISIVQRYKKLGIRLLIVTGNHDISNDVLATIHEKQPLGVLYKAGAEELIGWDVELPVFGVPWRHDWTTNENAADEAFDMWQGAGGFGEGPEFAALDLNKALAVTHAPIYPPGEAEKQLFNLVPTMGEHGISAAMGGMGYLYYGHIHEDHGIFSVEGVTYANMGALSRGSLTEYNVKRQIKIALWNEETGFEEIVVPHKPAEEVLKVAEVAAAKADKMDLDNFLSQVGSSTLDISSSATVIDHINKRKDVPAKVKSKAVEILEELA